MNRAIHSAILRAASIGWRGAELSGWSERHWRRKSFLERAAAARRERLGANPPMPSLLRVE